MKKFMSLVCVENIKLWKRLSTKIMIIILIGITVGVCGLIKAEQNVIEKDTASAGKNTAVQSSNWKASLEQDNTRMKGEIELVEKSTKQIEKGSIDSLKMQLAENQYRIKNNMKPETAQGFWENVYNAQSAPFVALLAIIACAALVAGEFSEGTMKTMISRPFSRWQILTAKFTAILIYTVVLTVISYLTGLVSTAVFFGTDGAGAATLLWVGGSVVKVSGFVYSLIMLGLDFLQVLVYLILSFAVSAIFRSRALATGLSIFLMFGGSFALLLGKFFNWGKFVLFADTGFSSFITRGAPFFGVTLSFALIVSLIYCIGFMFAGYFVFAKRDIC